MIFTDIFIKRPVLATVISLLILLFGLRALNEMTLRQFPEMKNTVITIKTSYPGANAELMQGFITMPIEKSIASAEGLDYISSQSADGISTISAYIRLNFDPNIAMTDIMAKVAEVRNLLPKESNQPVITKETGAQTALMYISFSSASMTREQITDYLSRVVRPKLQTVAGVASAQLFGGFNYAMRIWLNTEKMAALHVTAEEIGQALQSQNIQSTAGSIKGKYVTFSIEAKTGLETAQQFKDLIVKSKNNALIRLEDVARVELGSEYYDSSVIFNGKNAIFIGIQGTPTANPLTLIDEVKKLLPQLENNYPPDLKSKIVYDSTEYIRQAIHEVIRSIGASSLIVIGVIFLFLGALRTVTIPVITIPLSLIGVCSLLYAMGYSINLLTLLAMVIAIGLVVDDAIVVVENIYRHIEEGATPRDAALKGAREIAAPIISMTTTLAAVYAPIGFMTGLTGALFKEFAFTLAFAVIISGLIALTLSPMMCSKILNHEIAQQDFVKTIDRLFAKIRTRYTHYLQTTLKERSVVAVFATLIFVGCILLALTTPSELAPEEDQSIIFLSLTAPKYGNLNYLTKFTQQLNTIFEKTPATQDYFIINGEGGTDNAISGLILKPWGNRTQNQKQVQALVQRELPKIAGLNAVAFALPSIPGNSGGLPLQFVVTSTEGYLLINEVMQKLMEEAQKSGLFLFVDYDLKFEKPVVELTIDREKAATIGISAQTISTALATSFSEGYFNRFNLYGDSYYVIPEASPEFRFQPEALNNVYVPAAKPDELVPLSTVTHWKMRTHPNVLNQFQQLNSATIQGLMMPGKTVTQGLEYFRAEAKKLFPEGFSYDYAGESRQTMQEGHAMIYTFFFALIIIYLVLCAQFESFIDPLIILISVPLSIAGALIPLHLGLATLNIYTGIGLITLIGLITKHGILIVAFANQLRSKKKLSVHEAIVQAASLRLRPILMTTGSMILGVFPLICATGAGAESRFDIGLVIASGMFVGTCFTLFVLPTMYTYLTHRG